MFHFRLNPKINYETFYLLCIILPNLIQNANFVSLPKIHYNNLQTNERRFMAKTDTYNQILNSAQEPVFCIQAR